MLLPLLAAFYFQIGQIYQNTQGSILSDFPFLSVASSVRFELTLQFLVNSIFLNDSHPVGERLRALYFFNNSNCSKVSSSIYELDTLPIFLIATTMQPVHTCTHFTEIQSLVALVDHACTKRFLSNQNTLQSQKIIACVTVPLR